jgi:hypothetical protein
VIYTSGVELYSGWEKLRVHAQPCMQGSGEARPAVLLLVLVSRTDQVSHVQTIHSRSIEPQLQTALGTWSWGTFEICDSTCCDVNLGGPLKIFVTEILLTYLCSCRLLTALTTPESPKTRNSLTFFQASCAIERAHTSSTVLESCWCAACCEADSTAAHHRTASNNSSCSMMLATQ